MENKTTIGMNRTGIALSPRMGPEMLDAVRKYHPAPNTNTVALNETRASYAQEAEAVGTMPPPASLKEVGVTAVEMMKGSKSVVFLDKLGERLAFERTGTRLYQSLITRFGVGPTWEGGPTLEALQSIYADEVLHYTLIRDTIVGLGSDPTAITPSANITAMASLGLLQVVNDPRVRLRESLQAILIAELADTDGWQLLTELAQNLGHTELAAKFREAHAVEERHLQTVRAWLTAAVVADANMNLEESATDDLGGL